MNVLFNFVDKEVVVEESVRSRMNDVKYRKAQDEHDKMRMASIRDHVRIIEFPQNQIWLRIVIADSSSESICPSSATGDYTSLSQYSILFYYTLSVQVF